MKIICLPFSVSSHPLFKYNLAVHRFNLRIVFMASASRLLLLTWMNHIYKHPHLFSVFVFTIEHLFAFLFLSSSPFSFFSAAGIWARAFAEFTRWRKFMAPYTSSFAFWKLHTHSMHKLCAECSSNVRSTFHRRKEKERDRGKTFIIANESFGRSTPRWRLQELVEINNGKTKKNNARNRKRNIEIVKSMERSNNSKQCGML